MKVSRPLGHSKASHMLDLYGHAIPWHDQEVTKQITTIYNLYPGEKPKNTPTDRQKNSKSRLLRTKACYKKQMGCTTMTHGPVGPQSANP